ncbi:hypothetical protein HY061_01280 [Candidatus Azambacteria bacterium]|nr:hypothetical protein [Candidatus Azambacteria bacterium]
MEREKPLDQEAGQLEEKKPTPENGSTPENGGAEKKIELPEDFEGLKKKAQELGVSQEALVSLYKAMSKAKDVAENNLIYQEGLRYEQAAQKSQDLSSGAEKNKREKEASDRKERDMSIAALSVMGAASLVGAAEYLGVDINKITLASEVGQLITGLIALAAVMTSAPIARIQNWFARKKHEKDLAGAQSNQEEAAGAYYKARGLGNN